jgi:hypothetical protein
MTATSGQYFDQAFGQLKKIGFILQSDSSMPSVTVTVTGKELKGSWWASKDAQTIFEVGEMLADHPDVLVMKLIAGKVTFVHRSLWKRVYSIGVAREDWQIKTLTPAASRLMKALDAEGTLQANKLGKSFGAKPSDTARELELKLLLHAEQIHTSSGAHSKMLETWQTWARRVGFQVRPTNPSTARRFIEQRLAQVGTHLPRKLFPWPDNT